MPSIRQAQAGETDAMYQNVGINKGGKVELNEVEKVIMEGAVVLMRKAQQKIKRARKIDKGNLSDIQVGAIIQKGGTYSITIGYSKDNPASEYYDFNDKGVRGVKSGRPASSPYKFKNLYVSKKFVENIMKWYLRHKNYVRNEDQKRGLSGLQKKRKSIADFASQEKTSLRSLAINTAKKIKREGIPRLGFFEDNIPVAFGPEFQKKLSTALGQDIALNIKQSFNGNSSK